MSRKKISVTAPLGERPLAFQVVLEFEKTRERLDSVEQRWLEFDPSARPRQVRRLVRGAIRHRMLLDWQIGRLYKGKHQMEKKTKLWLRLALFDLSDERDEAPRRVNGWVQDTRDVLGERAVRLVNAMLRGYLREEDRLDPARIGDTVERLAISYSFPRWMVSHYLETWGEDFTEEILINLNRTPQPVLRHNPRKMDRQHFERELEALGIPYRRSALSTRHFKVDSIRKIEEAEGFDAGFCSVQDESASVPVRLLDLKAGDRFLDVCAAPGGKFTQALEEQPDLKIAVAVDNDLNRLRTVRGNMKRLGVEGFLVAADARALPFRKSFNKILADVPCSAQGIIRKHPDIKWRRSRNEMEAFATLQREILQSAWEHLEDDGRLVYSTCSIDPMENEAVVEGFKEARLIKPPERVIPELFHSGEGYIRTFPQQGPDGSFAALMEKRAGETADGS